MPDQDQAGVLVTLDIVIPRLSPSGGWEVVLIQRNKEPFKGLWALPGGHLNTEDVSLEAAAQREAQEETGLAIPLSLFEQVYTFEDFQDPRGKYLCLLYVLSEPLRSSATIQAGGDVSRVQWHSVDDLRTLPDLAFNHIRLLRMALHQMFTSHCQRALGLQAVATPCQCEASRPALFKYCLLALQWDCSLSQGYSGRGGSARCALLKGGYGEDWRVNLHYPYAYRSHREGF
jgi:ADP-ribose pyrophosphatase YjhB (NUDIX family)